MRRTCLKRLAILHHSLYAHSIHRTGKPLGLCLVPNHYRHCHILPCKLCIYLNHCLCLLLSLLHSGVGCMALLPEELRCSKEESCPHLPPYNICPLIAENRKVSVGCNPVLICIPDYCLRCWPNNKLLLQFCIRVYNNTLAVWVYHKPVVCYHSALFGKTLNVFCLLA